MTIFSTGVDGDSVTGVEGEHNTFFVEIPHSAPDDGAEHEDPEVLPGVGAAVLGRGDDGRAEPERFEEVFCCVVLEASSVVALYPRLLL